MNLFKWNRRQSGASHDCDEKNRHPQFHEEGKDGPAPIEGTYGGDGAECDSVPESDQSPSSVNTTTPAPSTVRSEAEVSEKISIHNSKLVDGTLVIGDGGNYRISGKPSFIVDAVPDTELDWGTVDGIEVRAASIRGRIHRYEGSVRQDSFNIGSISQESESYLFLCVADGLGSYAESQIAAREATITAARTFRDLLREAGSLERVEPNVIIGRIESHLLELLRRREDNPNLSLRDVCDRMRTTLTIALIRNVPSEDGRFHGKTFTVGDTSAWVLQKEGNWNPVTPVKGAHTDVFSSSVSAIPSSSAGKFDEREFAMRKGDAFFLMSDGIGDPLGDGSGLVGEALAEKLRTAPDIYDFARICDFARRTHNDDRTLLGIWMPSE